MQTVYCLSLAAIAVICALAVLHPRYHDNLGQRIGMAITCIASVAEIWATAQSPERMNASALFAAGVALFGTATLWKKIKDDRRRARSINASRTA
jgi:hypothetical protein